MHLFFIDESGSISPKEKISPKDKFFVLGGIIVSEDHWFDISKELLRLKEKFNVIGEIKWRYFAQNNGPVQCQLKCDSFVKNCQLKTDIKI